MSFRSVHSINLKVKILKSFQKMFPNSFLEMETLQRIWNLFQRMATSNNTLRNLFLQNGDNTTKLN